MAHNPNNSVARSTRRQELEGTHNIGGQCRHKSTAAEEEHQAEDIPAPSYLGEELTHLNRMEQCNVAQWSNTARSLSGHSTFAHAGLDRSVRCRMQLMLSWGRLMKSR